MASLVLARQTQRRFLVGNSKPPSTNRCFPPPNNMQRTKTFVLQDLQCRSDANRQLLLVQHDNDDNFRGQFMSGPAVENVPSLTRIKINKCSDGVFKLRSTSPSSSYISSCQYKYFTFKPRFHFCLWFHWNGNWKLPVFLMVFDICFLDN